MQVGYGLRKVNQKHFFGHFDDRASTFYIIDFTSRYCHLLVSDVRASQIKHESISGYI